jgi:Protein of unknown function (DUF3352)
MRPMRRLRPLLLAPVAALALLVAACGGSTTSTASGPGGSTIAPASASVFVSVDTDSGSAQWKQADAILKRFPARDKLIGAIEQGLHGKGLSYEQDIKPALGDEVDVVVLGSDQSSRNAVALTQPKDAAKFEALLAKLDANDSSKTVTGDYNGWTLVSDKQAAIDLFKTEAGKGALADDATFKEAMANEPGDALAKAYVNGPALGQLLGGLGGQLGGSCGGQAGASKLRYVGASLVAESNGVKVHAAVQSDNASKGSTYSSQLVSEIPSGALLVLSFHGSPQSSLGIQDVLQSCKNGQAGQTLQGLEHLLGIKLSDLGALFEKESALYVRSGSPIPEVTFVSQQDDPQKALATLDSLVTRIGGLAGGAQPESTTIDGVPAKKIVVGGRISIFYAALKGEVVVSDSEAGIRDLRSSGPKLKDDSAFQDAQKATGMPSETSGFLYVDIKDSIPLVEGLVQLAGTSIPPDVDANLRPLQTLMIWGASAEGKTDLTAFLGIE